MTLNALPPHVLRARHPFKNKELTTYNTSFHGTGKAQRAERVDRGCVKFSSASLCDGDCLQTTYESDFYDPCDRLCAAQLLGIDHSTPKKDRSKRSFRPRYHPAIAYRKTTPLSSKTPSISQSTPSYHSLRSSRRSSGTSQSQQQSSQKYLIEVAPEEPPMMYTPSSTEQEQEDVEEEAVTERGKGKRQYRVGVHVSPISYRCAKVGGREASEGKADQDTAHAVFSSENALFKSCPQVFKAPEKNPRHIAYNPDPIALMKAGRRVMLPAR